MEQPADLLVTEVFDTELIGEGAIETYTHAHQHLLQVNIHTYTHIHKHLLQVDIYIFTPAQKHLLQIYTPTPCPPSLDASRYTLLKYPSALAAGNYTCLPTCSQGLAVDRYTHLHTNPPALVAGRYQGFPTRMFVSVL